MNKDEGSEVNLPVVCKIPFFLSFSTLPHSDALMYPRGVGYSVDTKEKASF